MTRTPSRRRIAFCSDHYRRGHGVREFTKPFIVFSNVGEKLNRGVSGNFPCRLEKVPSRLGISD